MSWKGISFDERTELKMNINCSDKEQTHKAHADSKIYVKNMFPGYV